MDTVKLGKSGLVSSRLVYGCMRIAGDNSHDSRQRGRRAVLSAYDAGYNHFDHADIYGGGECETLFAEVLEQNPGLREKIILTSKCGIRFRDSPNPGDPGRYDFSRDYIVESVEGSLSRLGVDHLDLLLLHRPDYLFEAEEVARALQSLKESGKVRNFGVSNFRPSQFALLQTFCPMQLIVNQVEINIHNLSALTDGVLDQCQQLGVQPQAWSPIGGIVYPAANNTFSDEDSRRIHEELNRQADKYGEEGWVVFFAWLLKHPAKISPIVGSTNPDRIRAATRALDIEYSREDWYRLLEARNGHPVL